jgi:hypothetical protein
MTSSLTYMLSIIALIAYFGYITLLHGTVGFLASAAIFLILSAFLDHTEYVTIGLLIIGLTLSIYVRREGIKLEGFADSSGAVVPVEETPTPIPTAATATPTVAPSETTVSTPANPTPAQAIDPAQVAKGLKEAMTQINAVKDKAEDANKSVAAFQPSSASKAGSADGFQGPSAGLFKLGELPSEMKKGPFIDAASTMTKAMNALQPDQMAAMTAESQSLLETQKNLMGMLQSMRPVLQDGRQLLDTFSGIFGGLGGLAGGKVEGKA